MNAEPRLQTDRLLLRRWREADLDPFAAMNADPVVMEHLPGTLSIKESAAFIERIEACFDQRGYGLWAVQRTERDRPLIGCIGLFPVEPDLPCAPAVEVGWRLARASWGHGYATEAASAAIAFGFDQLRLDEIVSFTANVNLRSQRVMERLGMQRDPHRDFEHPRLPADHPLRAHVLYRISRVG
jgi:RimJ/RimL family protein N-acetyltransferase